MDVTGPAKPARKVRALTEIFDRLVSLDELLESFGGRVARQTVYNWVGDGMPKRKLGRRLYFDPVEVVHWLKARKLR